MKLSTKQFNAFCNVCVARKNYYWEYCPAPFLQKDKDIPRNLSDSVIKDHIRGSRTLGLSMFVDNNDVLYGGIDIDVHSDTDEERQRLAQHLPKLTAELENLGYLFFVNSSGSAGRHIRVYSNKPINAKIMRYFLIDLQERVLGECKHEVFPKQDELNENKPFGNQMKAVLAIHPKTKKLAGIVENDMVLDLDQSLNFLVEFEKKIPEAKPIEFTVSEQLEQRHRKKKYDGVIETTTKFNTPSYCAGFEEVACQLLLPSGKATRHDYLDGNAYQYLSDKPQLMTDYCEIQGRDHTAFNGHEKWNWSCKTIHKYLRENTGDGIEQWKEKCSKCPLQCSEYSEQLKKIKELSRDDEKRRRIIDDLLKANIDTSPIILQRIKEELCLLLGIDEKVIDKTVAFHINNKNIDLESIEEQKKKLLAKQLVEFHEAQIMASADWSDEQLIDNIKEFFHKSNEAKLARFLAVKYILRKYTIITEFKTDQVKAYDDESCYFRDIGEEIILQFLTEELNINNTKNNAYEILHLLKTQTYISDQQQKEAAPLNLIPFKNGILEIHTLQLLKNEPKYLFDYQIPIEWKPEAKCEKIDSFFRQLVNEEDVSLIYDIFGLTLHRINYLEKFFVFTGEGSNGKSRVINLLETFIGSENRSSVPLKALSEDRFAIARTYKKLLNVGADIGGQAIYDTSTLKSISASDKISAQFKHGQLFDFTPSATQVFSANHPPLFMDDSDGMYRRAEMILFPHKFGNEKDIIEDSTIKKANPNILTEITTPEELSGLLNKAIEHLKNIFKTGQLSVVKSTKELRRNYIKHSNSIKAFLDEYCEECQYIPAEYEKIRENNITRTITVSDAEGYIFTRDLYAKYKEFCQSNNLQIKSFDFFSKRLVKDSQWDLDTQLKDIDITTRSKQRSVRGIQWKKVVFEVKQQNPPIQPNQPNPPLLPCAKVLDEMSRENRKGEGGSGGIGDFGGFGTQEEAIVETPQEKVHAYLANKKTEILIETVKEDCNVTDEVIDKMLLEGDGIFLSSPGKVKTL